MSLEALSQARQADRARKARKWAWIRQHLPEFAKLMVQMRDRGMQPGEPEIYWNGKEVI